MSAVTPERLEMLLVARWLEEGASEEGVVAFSVPAVLEEMDLPPERGPMLDVMAALGELEARRAVAVEWAAGAGRDGRVTLAPHIRRDARRLFGR